MQYSPFNLDQHECYAEWRKYKLATYPLQLAKLVTPITDATQVTAQEIRNLQESCRTHNFALYRLPTHTSKHAVHHLAKALGLQHLDTNLCADADSLTSLQVTTHRGQHDYIPYTDKKLSWHTDGYYNLPEAQVHGMLLHCARPAQQGGESWLMDHEIAYILLRDQDPTLIQALMHPQAFTIPANILDGKVIRPQQTGPIFSITPAGNLHMRYSARQRNVIWRDDPATQAAAEFLLNLWQQDSHYKIRYTLQAGEGLICNNVLHCRTAFRDSDDPAHKRLLYRGRYYDRVHNTDLTLQEITC